jgi:geranylgeranyl reductase family protein
MDDVAVVGAGPAGASAALKLAQAGATVVLMEKESLPRYKVCGGGIVHRARALLKVDMTGVVEREFYEAAMTLLDSSLSFTPRRDRPLISMTMRAQFDHLLVSAAEQAGARVMPGTRVRSLSLRNNHVDLETTAGPVAAKFVIAADGVHSTLARQAGWQESRLLIPAIESELYISDREMDCHAGTARFDFDIPPHGYAWLFPKRDHLSVGVLSVRRGHVDLKAAFSRYLSALGINDVEREERHGFFIPVRPRRDGFARNRVILAGDAAGFADPVTGEGISFAIRSGQLAADALIQEAFEWPRSGTTYETLIKRHITPELSAAGLLAKLLYASPGVRTFAFRRYGSKLTEAVADIFMGDRTYQEAISNPMNYVRLSSWAFLLRISRLTPNVAKKCLGLISSMRKYS